MSTANIDTYEHDIANEIRMKEATIGDIASATGTIGNKPKTGPSIMLVMIVLILSVCGIIATVILWYIKYSGVPQPSLKSQVRSTPVGPTYAVIPLKNVSASIDNAVGRFITNVQYSENGYSMSIDSYSPVFSYMVKNENEYAKELAFSLKEIPDVNATIDPFVFKDVTVNNQNMRVGTSASSTVVYAFVNNQVMIISSTINGALSLRSAILH